MKVEKFQEMLLGNGLEHGFEDMEIYYEKSNRFACEIYKGELDHYETAEDSGLSFRGLYNGKMGYAYTEKFDEESIIYLLEHAKANAQVIEDEEQDDIFAGSDEYEERDFYSESLDMISIPDKIAFLKEVEKKVSNYDPRIVSLNSCKMIEQSKERVLANSRALVLHDRKNYLAIVLSVVVKQEEETKSGFTVKITKDFSTLNADEIAKEAAEEALSYLGEKSVASKRYPVIFRNDASASLLATFVSTFSAEVAQKGRSLLEGKTGTMIAAENITIKDDPFHEEGFDSRNFDGEGVASKTCTIIEKGILQTLLHNRKTAKKAGVETTGHAYKSSYKGTLTVAPSNFYIEPGEKQHEELVNAQKEAVIITKLAGLHSGANAVSGDFSVAANGFYVKDGKVETAVKQMTIAGNFFELLKQIDEVGSDLYFSTSGIGSPSLLLKGLTVTVE
ncbi:TldD/PmbA family protein [Lederbergia lenta]|uniref:Suppressor of the inhibitory activity of the cabon storage regulator (CsrA) n=1 Tax=Lederbergia lenta TaxID=1467 RepID=A0A2X4VKC4_LEDLE|nr:metallopeptidase TldD-related protein [Lederbergia lenta]MEC2323540.1 metallopeptidase TldD-related protein [Lederbergia lenta]SQI52617.1 suppressor of the inhibitory activity of the cabon storage regulator (CsrA) [Lederbergia lenta]